MIEELDDESFDGFVKDGMVVVDLYADWCMPCRRMGAVLEEVSKESTEIKFGRLNVDSNKAVSRKFEVEAIPTILFFKDGEMKEKLVGARNKKEFKAEMDRIFGAAE